MKVRYELDTGTRHFGKFGPRTRSTPGTGIPYRIYPWNRTVCLISWVVAGLRVQAVPESILGAGNQSLIMYVTPPIVGHER